MNPRSYSQGETKFEVGVNLTKKTASISVETDEGFVILHFGREGLAKLLSDLCEAREAILRDSGGGGPVPR